MSQNTSGETHVTSHSSGINNKGSHTQTGEHELKFVFPSHRVASVLQWLKHLCRPDPEFPCNSVSTIYYDTRDRRFLQEKLNSDYLKTKVRIRWYTEVGNDQQTNLAWLEIKQKTGAQRQKLRFQLPYSGEWLSAASLDNPILGDIPQTFLSHGIVLRPAISPVFLLSYERHRFFDPLSKARVCVDCHLSVPKVNQQILAAVVPVQSNIAVLEVKGEVSSLPTTLRHLINMGCTKTSFSKYVACYQQLIHSVSSY